MHVRTLLAGITLVLLVAACGGSLKYDVKGSQASPGSDARVVAEIDKSRNVTNLTIEAKNLTPAERLVVGGKAYVVWTKKAADAPWSRAGALELESDGREGKAKLTVPETAFSLQITAEIESSVAAPAGKVVFEQAVNQ